MRKLTLFILISVFLNGCSGESEVNLISPDLNGEWILREAVCFCFFPEGFNFGAHRLNINAETNRVVVENDPDAIFIKTPGEYSLTAEGTILTIDGDEQFSYRITEDGLELRSIDNPDLADDELTLIYVRNGGLGTSF